MKYATAKDAGTPTVAYCHKEKHCKVRKKIHRDTAVALNDR
jgi:hypothetical protein